MIQTKSIAVDNSPGTVTVIIPTTCERNRQSVILRAIRSVLDQSGIKTELIVVVNGDRVDDALLGQLGANASLRVLQIYEGHVSMARYHGLQHACGEFFSFLDDDDELLAGALQSRVALMHALPDVDVVVTNGYEHDGVDRLLVDDTLAHRIRLDQPGSVLSGNWFASAAPLFRRARFDVTFFDLPHRYFEWTYLFFRLVVAKMKVHYSEAVTFRVYTNTAFSASKSDEYFLAYPEVLQDLQALPLPRYIRSGIKGKYLRALNSASDYYLSKGQLKNAAVFHARCVLRGGWMYLPNARKIVAAAIRRMVP